MKRRRRGLSIKQVTVGLSMQDGQELGIVILACPTERRGLRAKREESIRAFAGLGSARFRQVASPMIVTGNRHGPVAKDLQITSQELCGRHGRFQRRKALVN